MAFLKNNKLKAKNKEIALDEIFLDSKNIPGFNTEGFEGRLEFPLSKNFLKIILCFFGAVLFALFLKSFSLEVLRGTYFNERARNNSLNFVFISAPRGEVRDRNEALLAWNEPYVATSSMLTGEVKENFSFSSDVRRDENGFVRKYAADSGLSLVLGFLGLNSETGGNTREPLGFKTGKDGIEKYHNSRLTGKHGMKITEVDSLGRLISENTREEPENGEKLILTIDKEINSKFFELIKEVADGKGFKGGAGIIMDVKNGEILALANYPEYNSEILSEGEQKGAIQSYLKNPQNLFLNRAVSGLYAPGSVIKPLMALAALNEGVISPEKVILTHGSISVPNPYKPGEYTIFRDWKNHGEVDMYRALAVSSDAYFYSLGGGYGGIKGLGIDKIGKYAKIFGFNKKTGIDLSSEEEGVIPSSELKAKLNPDDPVWRIGDTYHAAIGQGNFQVTPIEMAVYTSALANKGTLLTPHLLKNDFIGTRSTDKKVEIPEQYFDVVQKGMRMAVQEGTAKGLSDLNVAVAGKTGTAEIGKKYVNSWFIGFWPYENPRYSITVVLERGSPHNLVGGVYVARQLLGWMQYNKPEYLKP